MLQSVGDEQLVCSTEVVYYSEGLLSEVPLYFLAKFNKKELELRGSLKNSRFQISLFLQNSCI